MDITCLNGNDHVNIVERSCGLFRFEEKGPREHSGQHVDNTCLNENDHVNGITFVAMVVPQMFLPQVMTS